jgi:hypothetical protein
LSDESLFREVDEELRQEQFKKLWARYGNAIIGLCVLVIVAVAGYQGWRYWQNKQSNEAGDAFFAAAELASDGKTDEALKQFDAISKTGFADLARMREAAALGEQGKTEDAVKLYDAVAADGAVDGSLRDLARIRAATMLANTASVADLEARLKPFDVDGNPWRNIAREITAATAFRLKDYATADRMVQDILGDPTAPASLRQRAQMLATLLQPLVTAK